VLPLVVFVVTTVGALVYQAEPFLAWYYQWAWWCYILFVDALNRRLSGRSLIGDHPRTFLWLCSGSVIFWLAFEAINLRLGNWYYVMAHPSRAVRWGAGIVAFATVLPAIVETEELLDHLGFFRKARTAALRWGRALDRASVGIGLAMFVLPIAWPDTFFPLTWLSLVLLVEPWNRRHADDSLIRDLASGRPGRAYRFLLAGLICGSLWELWNFWARTKWMYTVPGFERFKLFEMPILGFLGFPPFALECAVVVWFVAAWVKRMRTWRRGQRALAVFAAFVVAAVGTPVTFWAMDQVTVDSYHVPVARLRVLPADVRERLAAAGLERQERLVRSLATRELRAQWSGRTGLSVGQLVSCHDNVRLVMYRGLGDRRAARMIEAGLVRPEDLASRSPSELADLFRAGDDPTRRFLERRARVWTDRGL